MRRWWITSNCYICGYLRVGVIDEEMLKQQRDWACNKCGGPCTVINAIDLGKGERKW